MLGQDLGPGPGPGPGLVPERRGPREVELDPRGGAPVSHDAAARGELQGRHLQSLQAQLPRSSHVSVLLEKGRYHGSPGGRCLVEACSTSC